MTANIPDGYLVGSLVDPRVCHGLQHVSNVGCDAAIPKSIFHGSGDGGENVGFYGWQMDDIHTNQ